jgi:hypothetical protein
MTEGRFLLDEVCYAKAEKIKVISNVAEAVDWQQQWADFAPDFYDGLAHIDLGPFGDQSSCLNQERVLAIFLIQQHAL